MPIIIKPLYYSRPCNHTDKNGKCTFAFFNDYEHIKCSKCNLVYMLSDSISSDDDRCANIYINAGSLVPLGYFGIYRSDIFDKALGFIEKYNNRFSKRVYVKGRNYMSLCIHRYSNGQLAVNFSNFTGVCSICGKVIPFGIEYTSKDLTKKLYLQNLYSARRIIRYKIYANKKFKKMKYKAVRSFSRLCDNKLHGYRETP